MNIFFILLLLIIFIESAIGSTTSTSTGSSKSNKDKVNKLINIINTNNLNNDINDIISKTSNTILITESLSYSIPLFGFNKNDIITGLQSLFKTLFISDIKIVSIVSDDNIAMAVLDLIYKTKSIGKTGASKVAIEVKFDKNGDGKINSIRMFMDTANIINDYVGGITSYSAEILASKAVDAVNNRDWNTLKDLVDPNAHIFGFGPKDINRDAYIAQMQSYITSFPDFKINVESITANGHEISIREYTTGTHTGEYQGIQPTNKKIKSRVIFNADVINGKFTSIYLYLDVLDLMTQLGVVPPPPPPPQPSTTSESS